MTLLPPPNSSFYRVENTDGTEDFYIGGQKLNNEAEIEELRENFQDGCDRIVEAVTAKGQVPENNSVNDIVNAIWNIEGESGGSSNIFSSQNFEFSNEKVHIADDGSIQFDTSNEDITLSFNTIDTINVDDLKYIIIVYEGSDITGYSFIGLANSKTVNDYSDYLAYVEQTESEINTGISSRISFIDCTSLNGDYYLNGYIKREQSTKYYVWITSQNTYNAVIHINKYNVDNSIEWTRDYNYTDAVNNKVIINDEFNFAYKEGYWEIGILKSCTEYNTGDTLKWYFTSDENCTLTFSGTGETQQNVNLFITSI